MRVQQNLFSDFCPQRAAVRIIHNSSGLDIQTPFNRDFVEELKTEIPYRHRVWDTTQRLWRVSNQYIETIQELVKKHYGYCPEIEGSSEILTFTNQQYLVEYVGYCKTRTDGESIALGYCQNNWNIVFSEKVLRIFFEGTFDESTAVTELDTSLNYYQILGVKQKVAQTDIKSAYRRMAKQWHPDVCHENNARERFEAINNAYKTLSEPILRKRYDAGLAFEKEAKKTIPKKTILRAKYGYVSPLRCGIINVDGEYSIGKIIVSKINRWDDWIENGKTAVSSWNMITQKIEIIWI